MCLRVFYQYLFLYVLNCTQCCIFSCFRCCTVDQHRSGVTWQEDWRPMRSTVLQLLCATDRAARTVHQRQPGLCPPVSTIPIIYIHCTLQVAFDVMFLNCWISHSHLCRLPIALKFSFSNAISSLIQTIRTNPNCSTLKNSRFIMEYTHSVWALNIQLRVSALIYVVVKRRKTWIGVNSYVNINEVPLMGSVCHCS